MSNYRLKSRGTNQPAPVLSISGTPVTTATEGASYSGFVVTAANGTAPYTFSLIGTHPAGLSLTGSGSTRTYSGTPTTAGTYTGLQIRVTDNVGATADLAAFSITVSAASGDIEINFGAKTRVGHGGYPMDPLFTGTPAITGGNSSNHWQLDDTYCIVPKNGSGAFGTAPPTFSGPYSLTVSDGTTTETVNITILPNTLHIANKTSGANSTVNLQLEEVMYYTYLVLGDTVLLRDGFYNPTGAAFSVAPKTDAAYTGTGRIIIKSENPLGARYGRLWFSDNVSNNVSWSIDIRDIDFRAAAGVTPHTIVGLNAGGGGHRFYNCNFEVDAGHTNPAAFDLLNIGRDSHVIDCTFKNSGQQIKLSNFPFNNVITGNTSQKCYGDFLSGSWKNITLENNLVFDKVFLTGSGAHTDGFQHLGVMQEYQIGTGNGSATTFNFTIPGAPVIVSYNLKFGTNGSPSSCQIAGPEGGPNYFSGNGIIGNTTDSPINVTTGVGQIKFSFAPTNGQPIYIYVGTENAGEDWVFGSVKKNIVVRNVGTPGDEDSQAYFFDDTYGTSRLTNGSIENNIALITFGNGIVAKQFDDPQVKYNTILFDEGSDAASVASDTSILVIYGDDGDISYNVSNGYNFDNQIGEVLTPNPNRSLTSSTSAYTTAFPNMVRTPLTTRAQVYAAFTPADLAVGSGGMKESDGRFNGCLFPATAGNTIGAFNDGTVFEPSNPTWVAAHPPAA